MAAITWDAPGTKTFETGVSNGVFYPPSGPGVAWNGLVSITRPRSDASFSSFYQDGAKVYTSVTLPEYSADIEAYTYPDEFAEFDGTTALAEGFYAEEQNRHPFGLSYQTLIGGTSYDSQEHYKIHLLYNVLALPSDKVHNTLNDTHDISTFTWEITTTPLTVPGIRPSSHFIIDSRKTGPAALQDLKNTLYGTRLRTPRLPTPAEIRSHFSDWHVLYPSPTTYTSSSTYASGGP